MTNQQLMPRASVAGSGIVVATGVEPEPDQSSAASVHSAIRRNRAFAAAGGHDGAFVFPRLRLFVITCLDPRTVPRALPRPRPQ
jgi:hypothetical protein